MPSPRRPSLALPLLCVLLAAPLRAADFNGDGYADLAIGCRGETVNGFQEAGAVHVLYGGPAAFASFTEQVLTEPSFGAQPDDFELFGLAVTSGDFNADGFDDLAICAGNEDVSGYQAAGTVFVAYGAPGGLQPDPDAQFHQDTQGIKDKVEPGNFFFEDLSAEQFGRTLAAGDFNADGFDDLALYVVESFGSKKKPKEFAGAIHVLKGSADGLTVKGNKLIHQNKPGIPGSQVAGGRFGWALAVADFDGDGIDDLAIGAPGEQVAGTVTILRGKAKKGLTGKKSIVIDEALLGGTPDAMSGHHFGLSLAAGAFPGGGVQLAIGAPRLEVDGVEAAGGVYVAALAQGDLALTSAQLITRATPGVEGGLHAQAGFGHALAAGDYDADGHDDLAVGCPRDLVGGFDDAGSVSVLTGSPAGLFGSDLLVHEDVADVPDAAEQGDGLGEVLAAGDFDGDGQTDLAIGAHAETIGGVGTAGGVLVLPGDASGLFDLAGSHWLDKSLAGIAGSPGSNDTFGSALGN